MTELPMKYTRVAIALHWMIALLIVGNVLLVWTVDYLPESWGRPMIDLHKSMGITVLGLALMRLLWRFTHKPPPLPKAYPRWERRASHVAHAALYVVMLALPLSGWLHDSAWSEAASHPMKLYGLVPWPRIAAVVTLDPATKEVLHDRFGLVHAIFGYVLYALYVLHVGAALKHQFRDKEPELQRMLP